MPSPALQGLLIPVAMLLVGANAWQRRRIRRAMRDLPTVLQRRLGPEPLFEPPEADLPDTLRPYAMLHRRTRFVVQTCWALALLYLAFLLFLLVKGQAA